MPRVNKDANIYKERPRKLTKTGKQRKVTRRVVGPLPKFVIDGRYYLSAYDVRNFLRAMQEETTENLIYTFRKHKQALERNHREDLLVLSRKEFTVDKSEQVHINPNRSNTFINMDQLRSDLDKPTYFGYLMSMGLEVEDRIVRVLRN
jgi:hypothetical protein